MTRTVLLAAIACVFAAPVHANVDIEIPERAVKFDRSKLGDQTYVQTLYARIEAAATDVCAEQFKNSSDSGYITPKCRKISINRAVRGVDAPAMTEYAQARRKGTVFVSR